MNRLRPDDYGYALEQNVALHDLLSGGRVPALMVRGHSHRGGVYRVGALNVLDAGTLRRDHGPAVWVVDTGRREATCWPMNGPDVRTDSAVTHTW